METKSGEPTQASIRQATAPTTRMECLRSTASLVPPQNARKDAMAACGADWLPRGGSLSHLHRSCILPAKKENSPTSDMRTENSRYPFTIFSLFSPNRFVMPKSFTKVQKHINKKRGHAVDAMHENSRDAKLLRRAGTRDDRVARISATMARNRQSYGTSVPISLYTSKWYLMSGF